MKQGYCQLRLGFEIVTDTLDETSRYLSGQSSTSKGVNACFIGRGRHDL
jgi:hypothetical protein